MNNYKKGDIIAQKFKRNNLMFIKITAKLKENKYRYKIIGYPTDINILDTNILDTNKDLSPTVLVKLQIPDYFNEI